MKKNPFAMIQSLDDDDEGNGDRLAVSSRTAAPVMSRKEQKKKEKQDQKTKLEHDILQSMYGVGAYRNHDKRSNHRGGKKNQKRHRDQKNDQTKSTRDTEFETLDTTCSIRKTSSTDDNSVIVTPKQSSKMNRKVNQTIAGYPSRPFNARERVKEVPRAKNTKNGNNKFSVLVDMGVSSDEDEEEKMDYYRSDSDSDDEIMPDPRGKNYDDYEDLCYTNKDREFVENIWIPERSMKVTNKNNKLIIVSNGGRERYYDLDMARRRLIRKKKRTLITECQEFLEGNCTRKDCHMWHNFAKLNAPKNNEILRKRVRQMYKMIDLAQNYIPQMDVHQVSGKGLDMMFIMDCTGSMSSWIRSATDEIKSIIDKIQEMHSGTHIRVSFVGYRDIKDLERFAIHEFTDDIEGIKEFISRQVAKGGGDLPEDVAGAFSQALKQKWKQAARYAVLVADAPCHGQKYHSCSDDYPKGDPSGLDVEKLVKNFCQNNVTLSAIKITNHTDTMFEIFQSIYKKEMGSPMMIANLGGGSTDFVGGKKISGSQNEKFRDFVALSASSTLTNGSLRSSARSGAAGFNYTALIKELSKSAQKDQDLMECLQHINSTMNSFSLVGSVENLAGSTPIKSMTKTSMAPTKTGAFDIVEEDEEDEDEDESDADSDEEESEEKAAKKKEKLLAKKAAEEEKKKKAEEEEAKKAATPTMAVKVLNYRVVDEPPKWDHLNTQVQKAVCHSWHIHQDMNKDIDWRNPDIRKTDVETQVQIAKFPFAQGAMRFAFYMKDLGVSGDHQHTVAKFPKKINKNYTIDYMKREVEAVLMCQLITNEFNDRLVNNANEDLLMSFVQARVYEIVQGGAKWKLFSVENYLQGKYQKYNNNAGWENKSMAPKVIIAQALTHFSWQFTKGYMMMTDLQGVSSYLTDPQIHCQDRGRFGSGDLGYIGMIKFFVNHDCNRYCRELNLINPRDTDIVDVDLVFFGQILHNPNNKLFGIIKKLCELCGKPYEVPHKIYYEKRIRQEKFNCNNCEVMKTRKMVKKTCKTCKDTFFCSHYVYSMRRVPIPECCELHRDEADEY